MGAFSTVVSLLNQLNWSKVEVIYMDNLWTLSMKSGPIQSKHAVTVKNDHYINNNNFA